LKDMLDARPDDSAPDADDLRHAELVTSVA